MKHELDQGQIRELARIAALGTDRYLRSRALSAAVAFHAGATGRNASAYDVLGTARKFEQFIKDGKVNSDATV